MRWRRALYRCRCCCLIKQKRVYSVAATENGHMLLFFTPFHGLYHCLPSAYHTMVQDWPTKAVECGLVRVPFRVSGVFGTVDGKFPSVIKRPVVAEYGPFLAHIAPHLHPTIRYQAGDGSTARAASDGDLYAYAMQVVFNLPPQSRLDGYIDSNYDKVQVCAMSRPGTGALHCPHCCVAPLSTADLLHGVTMALFHEHRCRGLCRKPSCHSRRTWCTRWAFPRCSPPCRCCERCVCPTPSFARQRRCCGVVQAAQ